jgi:hypothetical protein
MIKVVKNLMKTLGKKYTLEQLNGWKWVNIENLDSVYHQHLPSINIMFTTVTEQVYRKRNLNNE